MKQKEFEAIVKQVPFFLGFELLAYVFLLTLSCKDFMALRVVPGCAGGPGGFPALVASPVMRLVVFLVPRKVPPPAGRGRLIYIFQSFGSSTSPPYYDREKIMTCFSFILQCNQFQFIFFYFYKLSESFVQRVFVRWVIGSAVKQF